MGGMWSSSNKSEGDRACDLMAAAAAAAAAARDGGDGDDDCVEPFEPCLKPPLLLLLKNFPDLFFLEILKKWLTPTDRALFARVSHACEYAVTTARLATPRTFLGRSALHPRHFVSSIELLKWAREQGCPWVGLFFLVASPRFSLSHSPHLTSSSAHRQE